jgi:hypothetical protein
MLSGSTVFAWRKICLGEEITIDYRLVVLDDDLWECLCGAPTCSGEVASSFFSLSEERQRTYLPYAARYIQTEYRRRREGLPAGHTS